jgi:DNA-binding transcriptional MerR regulator
VSDAGEPRATRPAKSASAFRTIGEVAEDLAVPAHVLRFWEAKFPQLQPLKRGGGRRYYRPEDVALLRRIRTCLYDEGYTIRGVQKLLSEPTGASPAGEAPPINASLFPLEATEPPAAPPPIRRPHRLSRRSPEAAPDEANRRAELETIRRELRAARALLEDVLRRAEKP